MTEISKAVHVGIVTNHPVSFDLLSALSERSECFKVAIFNERNFLRDDIVSRYSMDDDEVCILGDDAWEKSLLEWVDLHEFDIIWVISFPGKIPEYIFNKPSYGALNFHFGKLPDYRGVEPIFWQIYNGEEYGALTVHQLDQGFDTGPIVLEKPIPIGFADTYGSHVQQLSLCISKAGLEVLELLRTTGKLPFKHQDNGISELREAKRPSREDLWIRWEDQSARTISNLIRAANPYYMGARTKFNEQWIQVFAADLLPSKSRDRPGSIVFISSQGVDVVCADQSILKIRVLNCESGIYPADAWAQMYGVTCKDCFH